MHIYGIHPKLGVPVRSDGLVLVKDRGGSNTCHWTYGSKTGRGYLSVKINGKAYYVHRLVLEAFVGPCPEGFECDHLDRNRRNNTLTNLRYCSRTDNNRNRRDNDRVDARGGTHSYENRKRYYREYYSTHRQYFKEWGAKRRKTHKQVLFSDGKQRWLPNSEALKLLKLPVKERNHDTRRTTQNSRREKEGL